MRLLPLSVVSFVVGLIAWSLYAYGRDARLCATGPSPEEVTMRDMHQRCRDTGGVWVWRMNKDALEMGAECFGGGE